MLRIIHIFFAAALAGCSPQLTETRLAPGQDVRVNEALYIVEPTGLYTAFRESCQGPGTQYKALGATGAQCRLVPTPDIAAQLIVRYDGALDIPYYFIERRTRQSEDGFVISFDYFATVPQKNGSEQRVYVRTRRLDRQIDEMFRLTGGQPLE